MLKYVNNGSVEPKLSISAKYLTSTGTAIKTINRDTFIIRTDGATLIKLGIDKFDYTRFKAVKARLRVKIRNGADDTVFKLYQINSSQYSKNKMNDISLSSVLDSILYKKESSDYVAGDYVLEFDLTKLLYNLLNSRTKEFYFAITNESNQFEVYDIANLVSTDVVADIQLNDIRGLDASYEYRQEEIGFAGVSSINLSTGKMIHKFEAIQTENENHPAAFHLFYNSDHPSKTKILGNYWTYSGDYEIELKENNKVIEFTDPSGKILILQSSSSSQIKEVYDIEVVKPFNGNEIFYICLNEAMYCVINSQDKNQMIFVDRNKNQMFFETANKLLTKIELGTGKTIKYNYTNNRITSIIDGDQYGLYIEYTGSYVTSIIYRNKYGNRQRKYIFTYLYDSLISVKEYAKADTDSAKINEASFTYSGVNLTMIHDVKSGIGSSFSYTSSKQVTRIEHKFLGDPDKQKYDTFDYYTFQTRVTDYTGFFTDYYFDYYGRCKNIIDCEAKSITRNFDEVIDNDSGNLLSESKLQINERNIIDNNSFDSSDDLFDNVSSWELVQGLKSNIKIIDGGVYGQRCLRVNKNISGATGLIEIRQSLHNVTPGSYTLKAFFKAIATNNSINGYITAKVKVSYRERVETTTSVTNKYYKTTEITNVDYYDRNKEYTLTKNVYSSFDWESFEKTGVYIPSGNNISNVKVEVILLISGSNYVAYIDDLSLSFGDHIVRYNYVNNGYFENSLIGWNIENKGTNDGIVNYGSTADHHRVLGENVLKICSFLMNTKKVYREIKMSGGAGEELLLTLFGKGIVTSNDIFRAFIDIHYIDTNKTISHKFDFDSNFENWQVLTRKIIADRAFDKVTIGIEVRANTDVYIDAIQLYKDSFGKEFSYTEKKSLTEMVNADGSCAEISYDTDANVTESTDESGDTYRYTYNDKKQITQISNNQNTRVLFSYEKDKKTETKIISSKGDILKTSQKYSDLGLLTEETDDSGNKTSYSYDDMQNKSKTEANGATTNYKYNACNLLIEQLQQLGTDRVKCTYTYDNHNNIESITADNGTKYSFRYTCDQQIAEILVDGKIFVKNNYTKAINGINTNLLTKQILGPTDSYGFYNFSYDNKQRLTSISFNNSLQVRYVYDEKNQITEIVDEVNGISKYLSYDSKGNVVSAIDDEETAFTYDYDNLNNLQKFTTQIEGVIRSFDYEYKCEFNDYTPSGYFARLQRAFPDEVIKGGSGINGIYGGKASLNTVKKETINVEENSPLGDTVASLSFKRDNAVIVYDTRKFNKTRKAESAMNKSFDFTIWKNNFDVRRVVYGWIKPSGSIIGKQRIFAFSTYQTFGIRFMLSTLTTGQIEVSDTSKNITITSTNKLKMDTWNLVAMKIDYDYKTKCKVLSLVLNDEYKSSNSYVDNSFFTDYRYFILGAPSESLTSEDVYKLKSMTPTQSYPINMQFRVAFASIGSSLITQIDFKGIYKEGAQYLLNAPDYGASGVTYYNPKVYDSFDVVSLNGSLTSKNRMKPKVYSFTEDSFKVEKSRMFKFDNTGTNPTHRHVYASYNDLTNLNKGNPSKLAYDLLLRECGTISLRFKVDSYTSDPSVILYSETFGSQRLKVFVADEFVIFQTLENGEYHCVGEITAGEWATIVIRYTNGDYSINVDGDESEFTDCFISLDNALTYIGCSVDINQKPIEHLNGCIEMLSFKDTYATNSEVSNLLRNGESISIRTHYDELGRTSIKKIHSKNKVLAKSLTYKSNGTCTTTKVSKEEDYSGNTINYEYDVLGNVKSLKKVSHSNGSTLDQRTYVYDGLSRLKSSNINGTNHTYTYDSNNNIKTKDNLTYTYESTIKDRLMSRSDGTTIVYGDSYSYQPAKINKPSFNLNLTWFGRRLKQANESIFEYNPSGVRIGKRTNSYTEKYYLDGDRISALKRTVGNTAKLISFVYDESQILVGFSYNDKDYFYDRNILGEIQSIIDKNGTMIVKYIYDDWGVPTIISSGTAEGNEISGLNPFLYKGYFYDSEIKLYYLKSRYYDPDLARFISPDAEVGSVGNPMGMNLYAYCKCNPINLVDENGNWPSWATKLCIGLAVIAVCAIVAVATAGTGAACIGMSMFVGACKGAAIGAIQGAISGAVIGAITEGIKTGSWEGAWKGAITGAVNGAADGFMFGAIGGAVSGALNPKFCFIGGTLVMTKQGLKAIEEIQVGDQVLAYNSNLDIFDYKDVVEVYENETEELCHIKTKTDEIICTPNHSILTNKGWLQAKEITTQETVKTQKGYEQVESVEIEHLEEKQKVYNFNVLGFHTYIIGQDEVIVHNQCSTQEKGVYELDFSDGTRYIGKGSPQRMQQSIHHWTKDGSRSLITKQFTPCANNKAAFMLEHIKMMESGFGQVGCKLLNSIASPGKKILLLLL